MRDCIYRDAAIKLFNFAVLDCLGMEPTIRAGDIIKALESIPAANVREVRRGRWKPRDLTWGRSYYYCSACEETVDMPTAMGIPMFRYCPNCGADMREADDAR